ncbi:MAG: hypothetical protein ABIL09_06040 [Gemmatimonadota bacterium]
MDIKTAPASVLLVAGVNASGSTIEEYSNWLGNHGARGVRSCILVESSTSKCQAHHCYKRKPIDLKALKMPWYEGAIIDWQPPSEYLP